MGFRGVHSAGFEYDPPGVPNAQRTLACWIRNTDLTAGACPLSDFRLDTTGGVGFLLNSGPGSPTGNVRLYGKKDAATNAISIVGTRTDLADGKWHHLLALVDQPSGSTQKLYVDGVIEASGPSTAVMTWGDFLISAGRSSDTFWPDYKGEFAEVAAWNRWLTAGEIAQLGAKRIAAYFVGAADRYCYAPCFDVGDMIGQTVPFGSITGGRRLLNVDSAMIPGPHPPIFGPVAF